MNIILSLRPTWWNQAPKCKIYFDKVLLWDDIIDTEKVLNFKIGSPQTDKSVLEIHLHGKTLDQTVVKDGQIVDDQLLHIDKISIDDIDLGYLIFKGVYHPDYPDHMIEQSKKDNTDLPATLEKIDTMGFNGAWRLEFTNPFHIWYLENLP